MCNTYTHRAPTRRPSADPQVTLAAVQQGSLSGSRVWPLLSLTLQLTISLTQHVELCPYRTPWVAGGQKWIYFFSIFFPPHIPLCLLQFVFFQTFILYWPWKFGINHLKTSRLSSFKKIIWSFPLCHFLAFFCHLFPCVLLKIFSLSESWW